MRRLARSIFVIVASYLVVALAVNGAAGILQPSLGAGADEGVLRTFSVDGDIYERRLAVFDREGVLWLASVQYFREWYERAVVNPDVELVRNGETNKYHAVAVRDASTRRELTDFMRVRAGGLKFVFMRALWFFAEIRPLRLDPR